MTTNPKQYVPCGQLVVVKNVAYGCTRPTGHVSSCAVVWYTTLDTRVTLA